MASFILHGLQVNMMRPYVPLYAATLDVGYFGVGVVAAAAGVLPIFFALTIGNLVDRLGARSLIAIGTLSNSLSLTLLALIPNFAVVIACQMLTGLCNLLVILSAQAYIGSLGKGRAAERNFGTFTLWASIGQIGGPLLGGMLINFADFRGAFLVGAAFSLSSFVAAVALLPGHRPDAASRSDRPPSAVRAWQYLRSRDTRIAILASCLMSVPDILRTSFIPLYLGEVVRLDAAWIGYVVTVFSVAGLLAKSVLPRVVARFGRHVMLFVFTVGCAVAVAVLPFTDTLWVVIGVVACMGLTFGLGRPLSMAMAANSSKKGEEGFVIALRLSGNRVVDFGLPIVFGSAASLAGLGAVFLSGGLLLLSGAAALVAPMAAEVRSRRTRTTDDDR